MRLFKDYSAEFKDLQNEMDALKSKISTTSDRDLIKIQSLEEEIRDMKISVNQMIMEFIELKQMLSNEEPTGMVKEEIEIAETLYKENDKGERHISTFKQFPVYRRKREYDLNRQKFFIVNSRGTPRYLDLSFNQLVAIIQAYMKETSPRTMVKTNPILKKFTSAGVLTYIYYWRAGSFNQTILDNARKLGYNPQKLINHECDDL